MLAKPIFAFIFAFNLVEWSETKRNLVNKVEIYVYRCRECS
jgi:hypothetical protein